jgi:hypothetical protein
MPNLFRHPTGHSHMHGVYLACGVLKQVQHDGILIIERFDNSSRVVKSI